MKKEFAYFLLALLLCALVFIADTQFKRGYLEWLFYILPLLLIYKTERAYLAYTLLVIIGILLGIGFLVSPESNIPSFISLRNRFQGMVVFTAYTVLVNVLIRSKKASYEAWVLAETKSKEIAAAHKELEAFSYSVSHDLRNPLFVISSYTNILREDYGLCLDEDGRDYLRSIDSGIKKMQQLIDDLLSLSKVSRQEIHREEFDLSKMALSILDEFAHAHPQRSVTWHIQDNMQVYADERLMNFVFSNLLGNAWKYTGKTEYARIDVGTQLHEGQMVFFVRDNGAGFDMSRADSIFVPFVRLHSEHEFSGTGIGLAIVERIIQRHGGRIWTESAVGQGATFYFTLQ